jgi:hypothetical protein
MTTPLLPMLGIERKKRTFPIDMDMNEAILEELCDRNYNKCVDELSKIHLDREKLIELLNNIELEDSKGEAFSLNFAISGETGLLADHIIQNFDKVIVKSKPNS